MRIIVFSDSHNNYFVLSDIMRSQQNADAFIHLGDGENEFMKLRDDYPYKITRQVAGNCDWAQFSNISDTLTLEGKKIFFTHGHRYGVKLGLENLKKAARDAGSDVALFGHTHEAVMFYEDGIYYMNPGSVTHPRGNRRSYGVIDITDAGIVTFIVEI